MYLPALAGIAAPTSFVVAVILQGLLQPDYSHAAMPISALAAWPYGWLQGLNFYVSGTLLAANVIGLHRGIRRSRGAVVASCLLLTSAAAVRET